jgi:hypothetical protein
VSSAAALRCEGKKSVDGPSSVVQSFQPLVLLCSAAASGDSSAPYLDSRVEKESSMCQRGVSYSDVGRVARRVSQ